MTGSMAIGGYDPYFMAAYQSYNPNFNGVQNPQAVNQAATQASAAKATASTDTIGVNTSFKGASEEIKGENKSRKGWVLTALIAGAAIFAGIKGHKIGVGDKWYTKTADGLKKYWNRGIDAVGKWKLKTNSPISIQQTPLALSSGGVQKGSFWFFSEDGKQITKCIRNGQEFDLSKIPTNFLESVKKDLGIAV